MLSTLLFSILFKAQKSGDIHLLHGAVDMYSVSKALLKTTGLHLFSHSNRSTSRVRTLRPNDFTSTSECRHILEVNSFKQAKQIITHLKN